MNLHFNAKSQDQFIEDAKSIHGNLFDYSLVEYKNTTTKVKIICPVHGVFEQLPTHHLTGSKCPECSGVKRYNNEIFIKKSNNIHDNFYDYSLVEYKNTLTKVKIICPVHGLFEQIPKHHLKGVGCPKCGRIKSDLNRRKTNNEFIRKSKEIHGDKYDYSQSKYNTIYEKVKIICPIHGLFEQLPKVHMEGGGCKKCSSIDADWCESGKKSKHYSGYKVYVVEMFNNNEKFIKIGITYNDINVRMNRIKEYNENVLFVEKSENANYILNLEKYLHKKFKNKKYLPLTNFGGKTECFDDVDIEEIIKEIDIFRSIIIYS